MKRKITRRNESSFFAVAALALLPEAALACPFCENGAYEAAKFIVLIFGLFVAGFAFTFLAWKKSGGGRNDQALRYGALEAEGMRAGEKEKQNGRE